jgi:hypothetical protein
VAASAQYQRTGLLYIRAHLDADGLRAEITSKLDVRHDVPIETAVGEVEGILAEVRKWLTEFVRDGDGAVTRR